jgi:hypothetical protein
MFRSHSLCWLVAATLAAAASISTGCSSNVVGGEAPSDQATEQGLDDACTTASFGDEATCVDYSDIKTQTHELCAQQGLILTNLTFGAECGSGALGPVEYTCCEASPPGDPDPNVPQAGVCTGHALGDGSVCKSDVDWKAEAALLCESEGPGFSLQDIYYSMDCAGGGSSFTKVMCCNPALEPPPPMTCTYPLLGDGTVCKSSDEWKAEASLLCEAEGPDFVLQDIGFSMDCAGGDSSYVKLACCSPANDPGSPPPTTCTGAALGDGTSCNSADAWKAEAESICASQSLVLTGIGYAEDCPGGDSSHAKFECCEP